jgi:hypothetical protein
MISLSPNRSLGISLSILPMDFMEQEGNSVQFSVISLSLFRRSVRKNTVFELTLPILGQCNDIFF